MLAHVPGATAQECGNFRYMSLEEAQRDAVLFLETMIVTPNFPSRAPDTSTFSMTENPPSRSLIKFINFT